MLVFIRNTRLLIPTCQLGHSGIFQLFHVYLGNTPQYSHIKFSSLTSINYCSVLVFLSSRSFFSFISCVFIGCAERAEYSVYLPPFCAVFRWMYQTSASHTWQKVCVCHRNKWQVSWQVVKKHKLMCWYTEVWEITPFFVHSGMKSWLLSTNTRDTYRMEALWYLCLWRDRGSEWFSPPGRLQEAQPAGCCFLGVFDGKSCEQTHPLCSLASVNLLCLFTDLSLICVKEYQMLLKKDQMHLNGKA